MHHMLFNNFRKPHFCCFLRPDSQSSKAFIFHFFHQSRSSKINHMSLIMRKLDSCICENKDADQICGNREADQRLCFRFLDSTIPLLSKSEISSL